MAYRGERKKYPIFIYLCYLAVLGILLTGVSMARYTGATSGEVSGGLSRFVCSFDISDASSLTFANSEYWLRVEGGESATNTARTLRFDMRNYVQGEGGTERISDVALQGTLRFSAAAEFAGKLALQVVEADSVSGGYTAVTPQYVLRDFIYDTPAAGGSDATEKDFAAGERTLNTGDSENFSDRTDGLSGEEEIKALEQELEISGGFTGTEENHSGMITATESGADGNGAQITISADMRTSRYSVGFMREEASGDTEIIGGGSRDLAPVLFIDCEKEIPYYTVDIALPQMLFESLRAQQKTFVLFITSLEQTRNDDFDSVWNTEGTVGDPETGEGGSVSGVENWDGLLQEPKENAEPYTLNGATVTGYHFMRDLPVCSVQGGAAVQTGKTTVDIYKEYDYKRGGATLHYRHVAPVTPDSASVEHSILDFYVFENGGFKWEPTDENNFTSVTGVHGLYGTCINDKNSGYIDFSGLSDDPYYDTYAEQTGGAEKLYELSDALSKGYASSFTVVFAQASESPAAGGGA